jgi:hypothetical protein
MNASCMLPRVSQKLAFLTVGVLHEPVGKPRVQGFVDRIAAVYAAADACVGFQSRSIRDVGTWKHSWGEVVLPKCYPESETDQLAMTLSLWDDLESVAAFAHHGAHGEALANRKDWFQSLGLPTYVAWWVHTDRHVDWKEGAERLDHLHAHGSTAFAFNFAKPFDVAGNPCPLDHVAMQVKRQANALARS